MSSPRLTGVGGDAHGDEAELDDGFIDLPDGGIQHLEPVGHPDLVDPTEEVA